MNKQIVIASLVVLATGSACAGVVVVGHPSAAALTKEQAAEIFLGKNPDTAPVDLPDSSPVRSEFYSAALGRDLSQVKAVWARLVFTGKAKPPKQLADVPAVKKEIAANPRAVGYIDKASVDASVKVLFVVE